MSPSTKQLKRASNQVPSEAQEGAEIVARGFEAMRKIQEEATFQILAHHSQAAAKLGKGTDIANAMAVQSELVQFDLGAAVHYWQELAAAALEMQTELMGCAEHLVNTDAVMESMAMLHGAPFKLPGFEAFMPAGRQE